MCVGGNDERYEFVVVGNVLQQIEGTEQHAIPGRVMLSHQAAEAIINKDNDIEKELAAQQCYLVLAGQPRHADSLQLYNTHHAHQQHLKSGNIKPELLKSFIPAIVQKRLEHNQQWLAELRHVNILFTSLPDIHELSAGKQISGVDPVTSLRLVQSVFSVFQEIVYEYDGEIRQFIIDDKGCVCIAVWGLTSHEDNAARCVSAALKLKGALERRVRCRSFSGVSSGLGFCGTVGKAGSRCEYAVVGDVVNLSARLMGVGTKTNVPVMVCPTTFASIQSQSHQHISFSKPTEVIVKGRTEPLSVYAASVHAATGPVQRKGIRTVGRTKEISTIGEMVEQYISSDRHKWLEFDQSQVQCTAAVIFAAAGSGKTQILDESMKLCQGKQDVFVLYGASFAMQSNTKLFAWQNVYRELLNVPVFEELRDYLDTCAWKQTAPVSPPMSVLNLLSKETARLLPLINAVLQLDPPVPEAPFVMELSESDKWKQIEELLISLFVVACEHHRIVLFLEDVHWFESTSFRLLHVLHMESNALIIVASRPLQDVTLNEMPEAASFLKSHRLKRIELEPMTQAEIHKILCGMLGVQLIDTRVMETIHNKAQGNPFVSKELAQYMLINNKYAHIQDGLCLATKQLTTQAVVSIPASVSAMVVSRVDMLSETQQIVIKAASVIGMEFRIAMVQSLVADSVGSVAQLIAVCQSLIGLHLFEKTDDVLSSQSIVSFHHVLISEAVYAMIPNETKQKLHSIVASRLVQSEDKQSIQLIANIAHHYQAANQIEQSVQYFIQAAEFAKSTDSAREAMYFYGKLLELVDISQYEWGSERFWQVMEWRVAYQQRALQCNPVNLDLFCYDTFRLLRFKVPLFSSWLEVAPKLVRMALLSMTPLWLLDVERYRKIAPYVGETIDVLGAFFNAHKVAQLDKAVPFNALAYAYFGSIGDPDSVPMSYAGYVFANSLLCNVGLASRISPRHTMQEHCARRGVTLDDLTGRGVTNYFSWPLLCAWSDCCMDEVFAILDAAKSQLHRALQSHLKDLNMRCFFNVSGSVYCDDCMESEREVLETIRVLRRRGVDPMFSPFSVQLPHLLYFRLMLDKPCAIPSQLSLADLRDSNGKLAKFAAPVVIYEFFHTFNTDPTQLALDLVAEACELAARGYGMAPWNYRLFMIIPQLLLFLATDPRLTQHRDRILSIMSQFHRASIGKMSFSPDFLSVYPNQYPYMMAVFEDARGNHWQARQHYITALEQSQKLKLIVDQGFCAMRLVRYYGVGSQQRTQYVQMATELFEQSKCLYYLRLLKAIENDKIYIEPKQPSVSKWRVGIAAVGAVGVGAAVYYYMWTKA